jgi:drug/metabolite transporter (DMT)-like permease
VTATVRKAFLSTLSASLAFAGMAVCVKLSVQHGVPLAQVLFYRGLISLLLALGYMHRLGVPLPTQHWSAQVRRGIVGLLSMVCYLGAIALAPLATAVTLNSTSPVILAAGLLVIHRERPRWQLVASLAGGLGGIVLLMRPTFDHSQWFGGLLAVGSAVLLAVTALNVRELGRIHEPPARTVAYFSLCILVGTLPWFLLSHPTSLAMREACYVFAAGALAAVGQLLFTQAHHSGHTLLVSLLGYSQVIFATLFGIALWSDTPAASAWLGIAFVIASGITASVFVARRPVTATVAGHL